MQRLHRVRHSSGSAIVGEKVRSISRQSRNSPLISKLNNPLTKPARGDTLESQKVGTETSNMGRSHRSAGDGVDTAIVPGRSDVDTGRVDIDDGAEVGEEGHGVGDVGGADGAGGGFRGGGVVGGVGGRVSGCDGEEHA